MKKIAITKALIAKAIEGSGGLISAVAKRAGCHRDTVNKRLNQHPELREMLIAEGDKVLDMAEGALFKKIKEGDNTAIIFFLKTKGKHRGYIEKVESTVNHTGGVLIAPAQVNSSEWEGKALANQKILKK